VISRWHVGLLRHIVPTPYSGTFSRLSCYSSKILEAFTQWAFWKFLSKILESLIAVPELMRYSQLLTGKDFGFEDAPHSTENRYIRQAFQRF
jgi:hypothetical protein